MFHVKPDLSRLRVASDVSRETGDSEERPFGRYSGPTGKTARAGSLLDEGLIGGWVGGTTAERHPQKGQAFAIPPGPVPSGRLSDNEDSSHFQQGSCTLCRHRRRPEAARHHRVGCSSQGPPAGFLGSLGDHSHPVGQAQPDDCLTQEGGPVGSGVEQDPPGMGPRQGQR
jgi:hypothetical protein